MSHDSFLSSFFSNKEKKTFIVSCHVVVMFGYVFFSSESERDFDEETDRNLRQKQHAKRVSPGWAVVVLCYWFSLDAIHARSPHVGFTSSRETRL